MTTALSSYPDQPDAFPEPFEDGENHVEIHAQLRAALESIEGDLIGARGESASLTDRIAALAVAIGTGGTGGTTILHGTTAPSDSVGEDGQYYFQITTSAVALYGPKTAGAWGAGVSLVGPAGDTTAAEAAAQAAQTSAAAAAATAAAKAPLDSPALTGTPTAPTAANGTTTTQIATTAFVDTTVARRLWDYAMLASPTFVGLPKAPTADSGTNDTQIATTAFVQAAAADAVQTIATELGTNPKGTDADVAARLARMESVDATASESSASALSKAEEAKNKTAVNALRMSDANILLDPFNLSLHRDGYAAQGLSDTLGAPVSGTMASNRSPFGTPAVYSVADKANGQLWRLFAVSGLGIAIGDTLSVRFSLWSESAGSIDVYRIRGGDIIDVHKASLVAGMNDVTISDIPVSDATKIPTSLYIVAYTSSQPGRVELFASALSRNCAPVFTAGLCGAASGGYSPLITPPTWGLWNLRDTRRRIGMRLRGLDARIVHACIGDSYTHGAATYCGPLLDLMEAYAPTGHAVGYGGGGWVGFGKLAGTYANGSVRSYLYDWSTTGTWDSSVYFGTISPDLGRISSSDSDARLALTLTQYAPMPSEVQIYFVGAAASSGRYSWDDGSTWTTFDTSGSVGALGVAVASVGMPTSGGGTLTIAPESGTLILCGANVICASRQGYVVHKLGATGSSAMQWAQAATASWDFASAIARLEPTLVSVMLGVNDYFGERPVADVRANLHDLLTVLRATVPAADLLLMVAPQIPTAKTIPMHQYAEMICGLAREFGTAYINFQTVFGDATNANEYASTGIRPWYSSDGVHPNSDGAAAITHELFRAMVGG